MLNDKKYTRDHNNLFMDREIFIDSLKKVAYFKEKQLYPT